MPAPPCGERASRRPVVSVTLANVRAVVKPDGMKGRKVEPVTIERKKLFEQVAAHLES
jgi:hypothetical protein